MKFLQPTILRRKTPHTRIGLMVCLISWSGLPVLAQDVTIYGSWTGKADYSNSYAPIYGPMPDPKRNTSSMPLQGSRAVKLRVTEEGCEIEFDLVLECVYSPDKGTIVIPEWGGSGSVYDSGLMITRLGNSTLELANKYTRVYGRARDEEHARRSDTYKYEMKGVERYLLSRDE